MNFYKKSDIPEDLMQYFEPAEIGLEETPERFVEKLVEVFREVKRVLKKDGTLWLNLGDSYAGNQSSGDRVSKYSPKQKTNEGNLGMKQRVPFGYKTKDLIGIPWMVAFSLRADGWYLRQDIIWHKPNPMPESVTDRCTKSHEYIFLLSKSKQYYFDNEAIAEPISESYENDKRPHGVLRQRFYDKSKYLQNDYGNTQFKNLKENGQTNHTMHKKRADGMPDEEYETRNKRSVWAVTTKPFSEAHFATFPEDLIVDCIKAGCPEDGIVLDPFMGAGTTALVARKLNRNYLGCELNPDYIKIAENRLQNELGMFI